MRKTLLLALTLLQTAQARVELEDSYRAAYFSPDRRHLVYERHFLSNLGYQTQVWLDDLHGHPRLLAEFPATTNDERDQHVLGWTSKGEIVLRNGRPADRKEPSSDSLRSIPIDGKETLWPIFPAAAFYALAGDRLLVGKDLHNPEQAFSNGYADDVPKRLDMTSLDGKIQSSLAWKLPHLSRPPLLSADGRVVALDYEAAQILPDGPTFKGFWPKAEWRAGKLRLEGQRSCEWDPKTGKLKTVPKGPEQLAPGLTAPSPPIKDSDRFAPAARLLLNGKPIGPSRAELSRLAAGRAPFEAGRGVPAAERPPKIEPAQLEKEVQQAFEAHFGDSAYYSGCNLVMLDGLPLALAVGPTGMGSTRCWASFQRRAGGWECLGEVSIMGEEGRSPAGLQLDLLGLRHLSPALRKQLIP
ncbi:hypothetical protein ABS71_17790 [bacterium SCN 62-11]|nr:MAG: hypothetical protein ABS71_17790 [bacterium SCN 62-11]